MWLYDVGIPIGNLTSQLFANIYLNELDQYCKYELHLHFYVRYMDDIIILGKDKHELHMIKDKIETFLYNELYLRLNNKTTILKVSEGITFVGYRILATHRKLKKQTARRIIRYMKHLCEDLKNEVITIDEFKRVVSSYKGLMDHCESYGLRQKLNNIYKEICLEI